MPLGKRLRSLLGHLGFGGHLRGGGLSGSRLGWWRWRWCSRHHWSRSRHVLGRCRGVSRGRDFALTLGLFVSNSSEGSGWFTNHPDCSIHFWDCPSKAQWSLHFLAHEDATSTKIAAGHYPATSLDALQSKSAAACLDTWRTSFARPLSQGRYFLPLKGGIKNLLQLSYAKGGGWLPFIGELVILCARATRAILNHAPIGEFRQRFFPAECIQCPCGHCQVETR